MRSSSMVKRSSLVLALAVLKVVYWIADAYVGSPRVPVEREVVLS
jgi:hypothetical protein